RFNLLEHRFQIVLLFAFTALLPGSLHAPPAVGAKLNVLFSQVERYRLRALLARAFQNRLHRAVDRPAFAVAANDGHDFGDHHSPSKLLRRQITTEAASVAVTRFRACIKPQTELAQHSFAVQPLRPVLISLSCD